MESDAQPPGGARPGRGGERTVPGVRGQGPQALQPVPDVEPGLIRRYDRPGPRYTSYPPATCFREDFGAEHYAGAALESNGDPLPAPLSVYVHIPFCRMPCFFCACNKVVTRNAARIERYVAHLEQEIELQGALFDRDRIVRQLAWGGGTPTYLTPGQMGRVMGALGRAFTLTRDDDRDYSVEIDPREVTPETLAMLRELGFNRVSFGVQDLDPRVQKAVNRVQDAGATFALAEEARRLGFRSIHFDLIYGLPHQSPDTWERTLARVIEASPDRISLFNYAHLPHRFRAQRAIPAAALPGAETKLALLTAGIELLTGAGWTYIGMDHFARPDDELARAQRERRLHRNFQGYTTHGECALVGTGMSAIGMLEDLYVQNERSLERYEQALDEGRLPVAHGLVVEPEDRLRREIIMSLICHGELAIPELERRWEIDFARHFEEELRALEPLERDDLVRYTGSRVEVLPRGRLLARVVCMVFDRHLPEPHVPRFSRVI